MPCTEIYTIEEYPTVYSQFAKITNEGAATSDWFCFPPGTYQVESNVWFDTQATSPSFSIDKCKDLGTPSKLPDFDTSDCATDDVEIDKVINETTIRVKAVTKYFSAADYYKSGSIGYKRATGIIT